jgi:hypothetical protein
MRFDSGVSGSCGWPAEEDLVGEDMFWKRAATSGGSTSIPAGFFGPFDDAEDDEDEARDDDALDLLPELVLDDCLVRAVEAAFARFGDGATGFAKALTLLLDGLESDSVGSMAMDDFELRVEPATDSSERRLGRAGVSTGIPSEG